MNETLNLLYSHKSDRSFTDEAVSEEQLDAIIKAAHHAPSSINSQQVSLVVIRDAAKRAKLAEFAGGQPWIAKAPVFVLVVLDQHKTSVGLKMAGQEQVIHETVEGLISATTDVGITLGTLMVAARSLGLGVVPIGGIRGNPQGLIDMLNLPERTFPLVGVCIGHVHTPASLKPRMPIEAYCHKEQYRAEELETHIAAYDKTLVAYWQELKRADGLPWSANTAQAYSKNYRPHMKAVLAGQGITADK